VQRQPRFSLTVRSGAHDTGRCGVCLEQLPHDLLAEGRSPRSTAGSDVSAALHRRATQSKSGDEAAQLPGALGNFGFDATDFQPSAEELRDHSL